MPVPSYKLRCTRKQLVARGVYEFAFERPKEMTFAAGQFVLFDVALIDNSADIQTRALSIGSGPHEQELIFVNKQKEGGRASRWIAEVLKPGDLVRTQGPFGNFRLDYATPHDFFFIATSTGVAPFRSQVLEALEHGEKRRMDLVFGVRSEEDLFWKDELVAMTQKYENFFLHMALSGPSEAWTGHKGRVQTLAPIIAGDFGSKSVYICGNPNMTKELKEIALTQWNVQKKDLHVEGYI